MHNNHNGHSGQRSAAHFRRTEMLTLDSGLEVEVRKPNVERLVMENAETGNVPEALVGQVLRQFDPEADASPYKPSASDLPPMMRFIDLVIRAALVWPKIVDGEPDYEAGEINMADLGKSDRDEIFAWAMPEAAAAANSFRSEQAEIIPVVQDVQNLPSET
jgi:hypothetical protein